jgi:hypothetical protein
MSSLARLAWGLFAILLSLAFAAWLWVRAEHWMASICFAAAAAHALLLSGVSLRKIVQKIRGPIVVKKLRWDDGKE